MTIQVPDQGLIFWPVGNGDTTTIRVTEDCFIQLDLHHMEKSENEDDPAIPVIDELIEILPEIDGNPHLSVFALSHPDKDHCQGFEELNDRVSISEIWMSPRTFREYIENEDLCDDAQAFHDEAMRRVNAAIDAGGDPGSGNRIRIIGYDDLLKDADFEGFPSTFLSVPGQTITIVDGDDQSEHFAAFVHAPFKDDSFEDRNDCSLAFQISLINGDACGYALLMGDLSYPTIRRIFNASDNDSLRWNVLLAPHHCSKSVMFWKDESEEEESLKQDIMDDIHDRALDPCFVVASSTPIPEENEPGDNPPHAKAKTEYEAIAPTEFFCTHQHLSEESPEPIIFEVSQEGYSYVGEVEEAKSAESALEATSPIATPRKRETGFGASD